MAGDGFNVAPAVSRGKQFFEIFSAAEYVLSYVDVPLANQRRMYHNRSNEHTRKDYCWRNPPHSFLLGQVSTSVEGSRQGLDASMDRQRAQQVAQGWRIMSLWPRNKPLVQPPHFRTGSVPPPPQNPVERAALVALNHARNDRSQPKSRKAIG